MYVKNVGLKIIQINNISPGPSPSYQNIELLKIFSIIFIVIGFLFLITNVYKFHYITILILLIFISISVTLIIIYKNNSKDNDSNNEPENSSIDDYLEESLKNISQYPKVTAGELFDKIVEIQNDIYEKNPNIGGILVHLMTLEQMEKIVNEKEFSLKFSSGGIGAFTDCSMPGQNKQNCSAWTYLRKDLPPIVFSYPSSSASAEWTAYWTPNCGIIVDPSRFWPLITTMGIVDSATDGRNCGSTQFDTPIYRVKDGYGRCDPIVYKNNNKIKNQEDYIIYQSFNTNLQCKTDCSYSDDIVNTNCRMQNSGGSLNRSSWYNNYIPYYTWDCPNVNDRNNWTDTNFLNGLPNCYKAEHINWDDIDDIDKKNLKESGYNEKQKFARFIPSKDCYLTSPTLYRTKNLWGESGQVGYIISGTNLEVVNNGTKQNPINNDRNYLYIGDKINNNYGGPLLSEQTWQNCSFNIGPTPDKGSCYINLDSKIPISNEYIMQPQAKFTKQNWKRWILEIKKLWKYIYGTLDKTQGYIDLKSKVDGNNYYNYNYIYANPCNGNPWWENEVNVFVNANMAQNENSSLNKTLRTSILGFFYTSKTCEDYMSELPTGTNMGQGCIFNNAKERCVGYLCNTDINTSNPDKTICSTKINGKSVNYEYVKKNELERIDNAQIIVKTLTDKFNKKYRNNTQYKAKSYKLMTYSNAFQSYNALDLTFNSKLKSEDILQEY
jgi:hypothetical protein